MDTFLTAPLVAPLIAVLRSRAVMLAGLTLIIKAIMGHWPDLAYLQEPMTMLGLALIAKLAVEDGAKKLGENKNGVAPDPTVGEVKVADDVKG